MPVVDKLALHQHHLTRTRWLLLSKLMPQPVVGLIHRGLPVQPNDRMNQLLMGCLLALGRAPKH